MAEDAKSDKAPAKATPEGAAFNPLWLVYGAGGLGLVVFLVSFALPAGPAAPVRELGLLFVGCGVVVAALELLLRKRDDREGMRRELLRRMTVLNDALLDLRTSLSIEHTTRFRDRRVDFDAGLKLAKRWLAPKEAELAKTCDEVCAGMTTALDESMRRRQNVTKLVDRLRREIDRAARRGDLDQHDADDLIDVVADAVSVLDEALYAELNANHFGRLEADERHFLRELSRYKSSAAEDIEQRGADLFRELNAHVHQKVGVLDQIVKWDGVYRKFETLVAGLPAPAPKPGAAKPKSEEAKPAAPAPSERFRLVSGGALDARRPRAAND